MNQEALQQATHVLRREMGKIGKAGSRMHDDTAEANTQRLRAINGICGSCINLKIRITTQDGRKRVVLGCLKGFSPLELYRKTELGRDANCNGFIKNGHKPY